ncbi:MAG: M3 family oligoendopeptidase [Actinomycetes bacterium]
MGNGRIETGATTSGTLPHWDVSTIYPALDSRELAVAHEQIVADLARLVALYERHNVRGVQIETATGQATVDESNVDFDQLAAIFDEVLTDTNRLLDQVRLVSGYLYTFTSTDSGNDTAAGRRSRLQGELGDLTRLTKRFEAWVERLGVANLIAHSALAAEHAYPLERSAAGAFHQMSEDAESLAADLRLTGSVAWAQLHGAITSRLTATVSVQSIDPTTGESVTGSEVLPMSVVRGLAHHPDATQRRAAFEAELDAWETVVIPLAAALNGAKGETEVVNRRRGWSDSLAPALFTNAVDRSTLDAMQLAVTDSLPKFHRYLQAKAQHLGHAKGTGLPWWDLFAPVGTAATTRVSWPEALDRVTEAFGGYSPALAALVTRASTNGWIDAEPRAGKEGGAFCLPLRGGESRVMVNFDGSVDSVQTLAHELGHAYHNANLAERSPMQRRTPMALAETASIFCETIMVEAELASTPEAERLGLLDTDLQGACQVVVDIHSRFHFEQQLCDRRARQALSVTELDELMVSAQQLAYGNGLDHQHLHPRMWAVKGHYFTPYYNWPYTYGLLFGIGLYACYRDDPDQFRSGYDELLASTGMVDAAGLGSRFGIDVRSREFWASSLKVLEDRIDAFVALVDDSPHHQ